MNEVLGPASNLLAAGIVAYVLLRNVKAPAPAASTTPLAQAEPSLHDLMVSLDQPRSRTHTIAMGRRTLDQFANDEDVGLIVIAVEPEVVHTHMAVDLSDKMNAIGALLDSLERNREADRFRLDLCRQTLGLGRPHA